MVVKIKYPGNWEEFDVEVAKVKEAFRRGDAVQNDRCLIDFVNKQEDIARRTRKIKQIERVKQAWGKLIY